MSPFQQEIPEVTLARNTKGLASKYISCVEIETSTFLNSNMRLALFLFSALIFAGCSKHPNAGVPKKTSAYPVSATLLVSAGSAQKFTATFQDVGGASHVKEVTFSIMSDRVLPGGKSHWSANQCLLRYDIATNAIWLVPDVGGTWGSHSITVGSPSTFSNSQCSVIASGSSVQISRNIVTINLELEFTPGFAGTKQIYLATADVNDKWSDDYQKQFGEFTVSTARP
jgi:hypothetical protein